MSRVLKPAGRLAVSLWCDIQENPYFHTLVEVISVHVGRETASGLQTAFGLSAADEIRALLVEAGFKGFEMTIKQLDLALPELQDFVPRHISATPMAADFNAASAVTQQVIIQEVAEQLAQYGTSTGIRVPFRTHLAMATK